MPETHATLQDEEASGEERGDENETRKSKSKRLARFGVRSLAETRQTVSQPPPKRPAVQQGLLGGLGIIPGRRGKKKKRETWPAVSSA